MKRQIRVEIREQHLDTLDRLSRELGYDLTTTVNYLLDHYMHVEARRIERRRSEAKRALENSETP